MDKIPLSLESRSDNRASHMPPQPERQPILGWFAVGAGLLGIFGPGILFVPLAIVFSLLALLRGQAAWGFAGLVLAIGGFISSPLLMGVVGLGAMWYGFDWQHLLQPILHLFDGGKDV